MTMITVIQQTIKNGQMDLYPVAAIWLSHSAQLLEANEELNVYSVYLVPFRAVDEKLGLIL
jgi:hypothetical protein